MPPLSPPDQEPAFTSRPFVGYLLAILGAFLMFLDVTAPLTVEISLTPSHGKSIALEWTDRRSRDFTTAPHEERALRRGARNDLSFELPVGQVNKVRLVFVPRAATITVHSVRVSRGVSSSEIDLGRLSLESGGNQEEPGAPSSEGLVFELPSGGATLPIPMPPLPRWLAIGGILLALLGAYLLSTPSHRSAGREGSSWDGAWGRFTRVDGAFVAATVVVGFIGIALELHQSSLGEWSEQIWGRIDEGVLVGESNGHRSDEWLVWTPNALAQMNGVSLFSAVNPSLGGDHAPLLMSVPVYHLTSFFRPQLWGFFLFDEGHALAWYWQWKVWGMVLAVYLAARLLGAGYWGALAGALLFSVSSSMQWWLSSMTPEIVTWALAGLVALSLAAFSGSRVIVATACALAVVAAVNFALFLYPPFQIPIALIVGIAFLALWFHPCALPAWRQEWRFRVGALAVSAVMVGVIGALWYRDASSTIAAMQATAYPGQRVSEGGGVTWFTIFSGWLDPFSSRYVYPRAFGNPNEGAGFLMLWPLGGAVIGLLRRGPSRAILATLLGAATLLSVWMVYGAPSGIERALGLGFVPPARAMIGMGLLNALIIALMVSAPRREGHAGAIWTVATVSAVLYGWFIVELLRASEPSFLTSEEYLVLGLGLAAISLVVVARPQRIAVLSAALFVYLGISLSPNPLHRGVDFLLHNRINDRLVRAVDEHGRGPVIVEDFLLPNLVKLTGLEVINGVKFVPDLARMRIFDPEGESLPIYNRYAHIAVEFVHGPPTFRLIQPDLYVLQVDPCGAEVDTLGVRYLVMGSPRWHEFACLTPLHKKPIYRRYWVLARSSDDGERDTPSVERLGGIL